MPCEGCNVQFTVFRRKRICTDCRRYYCSHCLSSRSVGVLCERCAIFAKRPLLKVDLLQLKPKDLIFYLQSKHISTKGCVEKEELVRLVLMHVNQIDASNMGNASGRKFSDQSDTDKPFDNIKQTCQNFFNNLTDKIASDFNFDAKPSTASASNSSTSAAASGPSSHITEQPRISTREIPAYSSFRNENPSVQSAPSPPPQQQKSNNSTPTSPVSSPVVSLSSLSSQSSTSRSPRQPTTDGQSSSRSEQSKEKPTRNTSARNRLLETVMNDEVNASECECSDDEIITTFKDRSNREAAGPSTSPTTSSPVDNLAAGPSASGSINGLAPKGSPSLQIGSYEDSSESSFEELGAIGGISDDNKTESNIQNETWQIIDKAEDTLTTESRTNPVTEEEGSATTSAGVSTDIALVSSESSSGQSRAAAIFNARHKRLLRRRSDGYLNRRRRADPDQVFPLINKDMSVEEEGDYDDDEEEEDRANERRLSWKRERKCCGKCGKNKMSIKHQIVKMRKHLENANMSETDIKRELDEFLLFLENRTASVDCNELVDVGSATSPHPNENDGIHVYAHTDEEAYDPRAAEGRFLNLNDFESLEELENLTVKQLKQVLTLNRVDYKGCCEKQELLERVSRLWKNLKSCPAVEKLPTDELCKICMDAPIECVILECGHMATCTSCGKVLSECPICRQYIVRVVRFFRA